ncbi:hypothetical protein JTM57_33295, partial [Pseudomonas aeruginosa]|nr:hypothetical protein [Pseudomonas aeruginosa]
MAIYQEVLTWADRLPPWRHDALRRLCVQGSWSEEDLGEILDLAKQHHGIASAFEPRRSRSGLLQNTFPQK